MSEYVWGAHGWLMTPNFFVLGLAPIRGATSDANASEVLGQRLVIN